MFEIIPNNGRGSPQLVVTLCLCDRPYQHASDMLAAIALTLKQCGGDDQVTPAVLALQGLQELCRAEVGHQTFRCPPPVGFTKRIVSSTVVT